MHMACDAEQNAASHRAKTRDVGSGPSRVDLTPKMPVKCQIETSQVTLWQAGKRLPSSGSFEQALRLLQLEGETHFFEVR